MQILPLDPTVQVALIAFVPSTIAAVASWRNGRKLKVSNGLRPGYMIEKTHEIAIRTEERLDNHILDASAHAEEEDD